MSEQKLEVFNVINFLDNGYDIDDILNEGQFGTFPSAQDCIKYMIDEGYLEGEFNVASSDDGEALTAEEISKKYTVAELKDLLRENGLKVSGKKQELVERLLPVLNNENAEESVDGEESIDVALTDKAKEYLKENEWMDLYMFALVAFRFEDYETYRSNASGDEIETALKFCDEIISRALLANQFLVFIDALSAKAHVYAYDKDYESFLDYDLQRFILGLNPIVMDAQTYASYEVINYANVVNLASVLEKFDFGNLKKKFDEIWNKSHIKGVTVPKKTCFKTLKKALAGADIEELNFELKEKYFNRKFGI